MFRHQRWHVKILALLFHFLCASEAASVALAETPPVNGIQPLVEIHNYQSVGKFVPPSIRALLEPHALEQFLEELEGAPPEWARLQNPDPLQESDQLFQYNRQHDDARKPHKEILQQPIAFLWSGLLRQYVPEHQGFTVAIGPQFIRTDWGIVRFKPVGIPDFLIAVPTQHIREQLHRRQEPITSLEIQVLFTGMLTPNESLIYGFSHDGNHDGMILPVVFIQGVQYFLPIDTLSF